MFFKCIVEIHEGITITVFVLYKSVATKYEVWILLRVRRPMPQGTDIYVR